MELQKQAAQSSLQSQFSVSRLCTLILDYWAWILQQDTCVLTQPLSQVGKSGSANAEPPFHNWEGERGEDFELLDDAYDDSSPTDPFQKRWNLTRFLLNEERARLCLWQSSISEDVLDSRSLDVEGPTGVSFRFLRDAILDSLARIGQALLKATSKHLSEFYFLDMSNLTMAVGGSDRDDTDIQCRVRKELEIVVDIALQIAHKTLDGEDQLDERASTAWTDMSGSKRGSIMEDVEPDLFSVLKTSIATLQSLSILNVAQFD